MSHRNARTTVHARKLMLQRHCRVADWHARNDRPADGVPNDVPASDAVPNDVPARTAATNSPSSPSWSRPTQPTSQPRR